MRAFVEQLLARWIRVDDAVVFDRALVALAVDTKAVPAAPALSAPGLLLVRPDGDVLLARTEDGAVGPAWRRRDRDLGYVALAARHPELAALAPARPASARDCDACRRTGRVSDGSQPSLAVAGIGDLCVICAGKGWQRDALAEVTSPLQALFTAAWTTWGLGDAIAIDPRRALEERGLAVAPTVAVDAYANEAPPPDDAPYCPDCQLNVQRLDVVRGRSAAPPRSALEEWLAVSDGDEDEAAVRASLTRHGLALTENIVVSVVEDRAAPSLIALTLGEAGHVCCCEDPELWGAIDARLDREASPDESG